MLRKKKKNECGRVGVRRQKDARRPPMFRKKKIPGICINISAKKNAQHPRAQPTPPHEHTPLFIFAVLTPHSKTPCMLYLVHIIYTIIRTNVPTPVAIWDEKKKKLTCTGSRRKRSCRQASRRTWFLCRRNHLRQTKQKKRKMGFSEQGGGMRNQGPGDVEKCSIQWRPCTIYPPPDCSSECVAQASHSLLLSKQHAINRTDKRN